MAVANPSNIYQQIITKKQAENESVEQLNIELKQNLKYATANLQTPQDWYEFTLKNALIAQIRSDKTRKKLLAIQDKSYPEVLNVAKAEELVEMKNRQIVSTRTQSQVHATSTYKSQSRGQQNQPHQGQQGNHHGRSQSKGRGRGNFQRGRSPSITRSKNCCPWCGKEKHDKKNCPATNSSCSRCGKKGHWSPVCRSPNVYFTENGQSDDVKKVQENPTANSVTSKVGRSDGSVYIVGSVLSQVNSSLSTSHRPVEPLDMQEVILSTRQGTSMRVKILADTGANVNILPLDIALKLGMEQTEIPKPPILLNKTQMDTRGYIDTDIFIQDSEGNQNSATDVRWLVAKDADKALLSRQMCQELNIVKMNTKPFLFTSNNVEVQSMSHLTSEKEVDNNEDAQKKMNTPISLGHGPELDRIASKYPDIFCGRVRGMAGEPATIDLTPDAVPVSTGAFRDIAEAYKEPLKHELDSQVQAGLIEPVDGPSEWLHPIVVVPKKGTKDVRLCVDLRRLNKFCIRPVNPQPTPWELVRKIPKEAKHFAVFDALKGYHQINLDEKSRSMTTFWTPFGKYRYRSLPMGYAASQDIFTDRFGRAVDKVIDGFRATEDCLIFGYNLPDFLEKIERFFEACNKANITLNTKKIQLGSEVIFAGYEISQGCYKIDPTLTNALRSFPVPTSQTDVKSFLGLANQICNFTDKIAELTSPLKDLLKKNTTFVWTADHQIAFDKAKDELSSEKYLSYFDHKRKTRLYADASRLNGIGFILRQEHGPEDWRTVQTGSRFLSSAETRYAMIELELLAIAWAVKKCAPFIEGIGFELMTDHKPLIPILNQYSLAEIENKRLQRLRMKIDHLQFHVTWIPGTKNEMADALSRAPVRQAVPEDEIDEEAAHVNQVLHHHDEEITQLESDLMLQDILKAAKDDEGYLEVCKWFEDGKSMPADGEKCPVHLKSFWNVREELSLDDGLLFKDGRLVIPKGLRQRYLDNLINLHQGYVKMAKRARRSLWWPFMNKDVKALSQRCQSCVERSPSNKKEPEIAHEKAVYPFQRIHMDFCNYAGQQWLAIGDQFSGFPLLRRFGKEALSSDVIKYLKNVFENFGIPKTIYSDGGPQFISQEFEKMCKEYRIDHRISSPHHPQSNGLAEQTVKQMKRLLHCTYNPQIKTVDPDRWMKAIILFRNTPRSPSGFSPNELLFGRQLRDILPADRGHYLPQHRQAIEARFDELRRRQPQPGTPLSVLKPGQEIYLQDPETKRWTKQGVVQRRLSERSYLVETGNGRTYRRNRRFLKPRIQPPSAIPQPPLPPVKSALAPSPSDPTPTSRPTRERKRTVRFEDERDQIEAERKKTEKRGRKKMAKEKI
jgi:hypothetical protein